MNITKPEGVNTANPELVRFADGVAAVKRGESQFYYKEETKQWFFGSTWPFIEWYHNARGYKTKCGNEDARFANIQTVAKTIMTQTIQQELEIDKDAVVKIQNSLSGFPRDKKIIEALGPNPPTHRTISDIISLFNKSSITEARNKWNHQLLLSRVELNRWKKELPARSDYLTVKPNERPSYFTDDEISTLMKARAAEVSLNNVENNKNLEKNLFRRWMVLQFIYLFKK